MDDAERYELTADEILYLSAELGMDRVYGVPDGLSLLSRQALQMRVLEIEDSLSRKGYQQSDFDGNRQTDSRLLQMLETCGDQDGLICFESCLADSVQTGRIYFIRGERICKMTPVKDRYHFVPVSREEMKTEILRELVWKETEETAEHSFTILRRDLEKAARLAGRSAQERAKEVLLEAGADIPMAEIILDGMAGRADFYSLFFLDSWAEGTPGQSVQFLQGKILAVIEYDTVNDEDCVTFRGVEQKELDALLETGFAMLEAALRTAKQDMEFA